MFIVSQFNLDSNGRSTVQIILYTTKDEALVSYDNLKKKMSSQNNTDENSYVKEVIKSNDDRYFSQEGNWKRPQGVEMKYIDTNVEINLRAWPDEKTYF